jgi:hypothetical protein
MTSLLPFSTDGHVFEHHIAKALSSGGTRTQDGIASDHGDRGFGAGVTPVNVTDDCPE